MAAKKRPKLREFVVRLESPGLYDQLFNESIKRTRRDGHRVPMTDIVREALEEHLAKPKVGADSAKAA